MGTPSALASAKGGDRDAFAALVAPHLRNLKIHCYRMSGSWQEAQDLLQDGLLRAWKGIDQFRGDSSLKTWLYAITTRSCLDSLEKQRERSLPMALGPPSAGSEPPVPAGAEVRWLEPMPGDAEVDTEVSPEVRLSRRESVGLAFLTLVQKIPPRQRAVLLLRDVLGWPAADCAEILETSVASVNSALQRAREMMGAEPEHAAVEDATERDLLARYVRAWETSDVEALLALLVSEATLAMPPLASWYRGLEAIGHQMRAMAMPPGSAGTRRFALTRANGGPAVAVWRIDPASGELHAEAIHVLGFRGPKIESITAFLDPGAFVALGLAPSGTA